jgi:hypothetical protein
MESTIPGIDRRLAITIISEIGTDMSEFGSSRRLCSWAGLVPGNNQSAGKKKSVKVSGMRDSPSGGCAPEADCQLLREPFLFGIISTFFPLKMVYSTGIRQETG